MRVIPPQAGSGGSTGLLSWSAALHGDRQASDGERNTPVSAHATVTVEIDPAGPLVIDVAATLRRAADRGLFDVPPKGP